MDIVSRVKNILMAPKIEWPVIAVEPADVTTLYNGYIITLSAIPALAGLIGMMILGVLPFGEILVVTITNYIVGLVAIFVFAVIAAKLAPRFGGRDNLVQGLKLLAFSGTAGWVGGVFLVIPMIGGLICLVFEVYGIYLLYLGATPTLGIPESRVLSFVLALIVVTILIAIVIYAVMSALGIAMM
jgi:hypothetical protein